MAFTLSGNAVIAGQAVKEKTAVKLSDGDSLEIEAEDTDLHVLVMSAPALQEPVVWGGPIVMNTREELRQAFDDLQNGTFIKHSPSW